MSLTSVFLLVSGLDPDIGSVDLDPEPEMPKSTSKNYRNVGYGFKSWKFSLMS